MLADYYTRHDVLNDEEIKILKDIAEPRQEQAGIGGPNKEKTWHNKITDKLKRNSTVFWFRAGENAEADEAYVTGFIEPLKAASKDLQAAGMYFMQNGMKNPNNALAGSYDFMHMFGHVCLGLMWAMMGKASMEALAAGSSDVTFHETKLATGRYYMARQLPATAMHLARIQSGAEPVMALDAANF